MINWQSSNLLTVQTVREESSGRFSSEGFGEPGEELGEEKDSESRRTRKKNLERSRNKLQSIGQPNKVRADWEHKRNTSITYSAKIYRLWNLKANICIKWIVTGNLCDLRPECGWMRTIWIAIWNKRRQQRSSWKHARTIHTSDHLVIAWSVGPSVKALYWRPL